MGKIADYYTSSAVTSKYGDGRAGGRKHRGVDFSHSTKPGTVAVPAMRPGVVVGKRRPSSSHGFGNGIIIRSVLDDGNEWYISYNHGHYYPSQKVGDKIAAGEIILHEGRTGSTTGSCVHIEQQRVGGGFVDPLPEALRCASRDVTGAVIQKRTAAYVNRRKEPNTKSPALPNGLKANVVGNFVGFIRGESVEGNNIWFKGTSGNYFWSGGFKDQSTAGMRDLGDVTKTVVQRRTAAYVNRRKEPNTKSPALSNGLKANVVGNFVGFIRGESVEGNNIWFKGTSGNYFWSGGFKDRSTAGMRDLGTF